MKLRGGEMEMVKNFYLKVLERKTNFKLVKHGGICHEEGSGPRGGIQANPFIITRDLQFVVLRRIRGIGIIRSVEPVMKALLPLSFH
jgi:hypothetical protein